MHDSKRCLAFVFVSTALDTDDTGLAVLRTGLVLLSTGNHTTVSIFYSLYLTLHLYLTSYIPRGHTARYSSGSECEAELLTL